MNPLADKLQSALGADAVTSDSEFVAAHSVDGKSPHLLCLPGDAAQVATALRICCEAKSAVVPWGGGTAMRIGNVPRRLDVVIDLRRLNRLIEHDHANLTATVGSGITLAAVQRLLARENQFVALEAPHPERATVGGTIAANLNGPRRNFYGSVRDLVIGIKVALATGELIKAGGKVVKNVAGYDMCKLFVGSLGTLGIITEVTLRTAPAPERAATLLGCGTLPQNLRAAEELSRLPVFPAAVVILTREGAHEPLRKWAIAVWTEGFAESVARQLREAEEVAARNGLETETLENDAHGRFWDKIRDFPLIPDQLVYRLTLPRAFVGKLESSWERWRASESVRGLMADAASGVVWLSLEPNDSAGGSFSDFVSFAREYGGHAIMFTAPPHLKQGIDVWGSPPAALSLMHQIKRQFDPDDLLNPGRFVSGI